MTRIIALTLCLFSTSNWAYGQMKKEPADKVKISAPVPAAKNAEPAVKIAKATFAGGCFWCMEPPFDKLDGVISTVSGYSGGDPAKATYVEVSDGGTGHKEVVQVTFDPSKISYEKLIAVYWKNIDPFDAAGQFCDKGSQYQSAVYYHDEEQKKIATQTKEKLFADSSKNSKVATEIIAFKNFFAAEDYHQDYYKKNPVRYKFYRYNCGRDKRLKDVWGENQ
jgi:peptide-methionine (S)-S-oxide reductase